MKTIAILILSAIALATLGCSSRNVNEVKAQASATFKQAGFEVVGYEGYERGGIVAPDYGGARVWYTLRRIPDNGIIYHASVQRWGDEYHIYSLKAIDAIKP